MKTRAAKPSTEGYRRRPHLIVAIVLLVLGLQTGCGREFYREWANQDVAEAVFEKSRDPRYRMDQISVDPPALARFADPFDSDRPPAPPDDFAAQALSPVPQWPDHRLIMPLEGTGYLRLLDEGPKYDSPVKRDLVGVPAAAPTPNIPPAPSIDNPGPFKPGQIVPPSGSPLPGPGASRSNSGTRTAGMSPTSLAARPSPTPVPPATRPGSPTSLAPSAANPGVKDDGVRRAATQNPPGPMPTQTPPNQLRLPKPNDPTSPTDLLKTPQATQDPLPIDPDMSKKEDQAEANLAKMFVPETIPFDEAVAAGLAAGSRPYVLSMEKAFQLVILNSRVYQFQLENVYGAALPVTLQRFSFGPQFIAGLSPTTAIGGAGGIGGILPTDNPGNSFTYATRATGSQSSALNYGTVVGVGKAFDNGAKVLASFANQLVFNFVGKNPMQPTVKSFIPIQAVVPFLRGGGRAVTLEALTQAERNLLYAVRTFALFRQQLTVATLTGGTEIQFGTNVQLGGFSTGGNSDPTIGFLNVVEDIAIVENNVKNLSVFERFAIVYKELINGENSGLTKLQLDQVNQQVQNARITLINSQTSYRNDIDQFKIQLGMPPDIPLVIDRARTAGFKKIFEEIDKWTIKPKHELAELDEIVSRLPVLEDLVIDGRSCQEVFFEKDTPRLEDLLLAAERMSLENRLDLMNARAQLYDAWRQIRVSANALKGVLNVAVTNQYLTPPTTNNPFGFVNQAKTFSLVFNAELPLVRVAERNTFRTALINYQRARRTLQSTEDFLKFQLRQEIRAMQVQWFQYQVQKRALVLSILVKDQAFQQLIAPPQPGVVSNGSTNTLNLIQAQGNVIGFENNLLTSWYQYQLQRLQIYRDLGILPYDEWEAFDELFPANGSDRGSAVAIGSDGRPAVARSARPEGSGGAIKAIALVVVVVLVGAVAIGAIPIPGVKKTLSGLFASSKTDVITAMITPQKLTWIVKEKGNLESAANKDVLCEVEGGTTIIKIAPEGTPVKAGEVVAELDSASLRDLLINQKITTQQAEASFKQAKLVREVAEYAVKEYELGIYLQDKATYNGQIKLAQSDQERAIDRLKWSTEMKDKGYVSIATYIADQLTKQQADFDLEQAQMQLDVLEKYTKQKQIKSLNSDVEKAKADEYSKQSSFTLEQTKEKKLEKQIDRCTLRATADGIVVYANDPGRMGGQNAVQIEEGASVRERQKIFSLPDLTKMRVNTKVHESMVDRIKPGLRALVRVDAAANETIKGQVFSVAPMADANQAFSSDIKVYTTFVSLEGDTNKLNLRPGMTAQVEILVTELPDVLSVPVQSILQFKEKDYVFVKEGDGFRKQEVTLGISNDQHVEVKKGIQNGDHVAMTPNSLLTEDEKREAYSVAAKDAAKKDFSGDPNAKGAMPKGIGSDGSDDPSAPKAKGKGKGQRGAGGGNPLMQKLSPEDRQKFFSASPEEKIQMLKAAGASDDEIQQMMERMQNGGGGGGGRGRGGPGGGGGFGGGPGGGPGQ